MASGTITGSTSNKYIDSKIEWSSTTSIANNSSSITAILYYRRNNSWSGTPTSGTGTFEITIDGQKGSTTVGFTISNGGAWVQAVAVTKTVLHNNDGSRSITISASGSISVASLTSSYGGTATLDNIPRQATMTSAANFNDESNPSFTFTNPANAPLECWLEPNPNSNHLCIRTPSGTGGTYTWNLTEAERKQLRSACKGNSCTCRIGLYSTIGGTTYASFLDKTLTIVNGIPTFTANQITYADTNNTVNAITGNNQHIVQNQSNLKITFTNASSKKESTISKYTITVNGTTKTVTSSGTVNFGKINASTNVEAVITATDSRGNTATAKKAITVIAWSPPILTVDLKRLNNYEDETYLTVNSFFSSVNNKNSIEISNQYKESGGTYTSATAITNNTKYTINCDKNKSYIFKISVADKFSTITNEYVLSKGKFPLFIDTQKNAVGINDFPAENEALRVAEGVARFVDGIILCGSTKNFLVTVTDSGTLNITEYT